MPETPPRKRERYEKRQDEVERKKISRCVALSAILLLGVCIALMGVSFTLTSKIDEMGEYNTASIPNSYFDIF